MGAPITFSAVKRPRQSRKIIIQSRPTTLKNFNSQSTTWRILANGPSLCQVKSSRVIVYRLALGTVLYFSEVHYCPSREKAVRVGEKIQNCRSHTRMRHNDMCFRGTPHMDLTINLFLPLHVALWTVDPMAILEVADEDRNVLGKVVA